jgi:hypothetical protein
MNRRTAFSLDRAIADGKRPRFPSPVPDSLTNLIRRCWDQKPSNRPSATEIVELLDSGEVILKGFDLDAYHAYQPSLHERELSFRDGDTSTLFQGHIR